MWFPEHLEDTPFKDTLKLTHVRQPTKFVLTKGQLISKGHFAFFNSPKKRTQNFCLSRLGQKFKFSSSFFGKIGDTKKTFQS